VIALETLDVDTLLGVSGGQQAPNTTTVTNGDQTVSTQRTDYGYCVDTVRQSCTQANTHLFGLYTDQRSAAQCRIQEMPRVCGTPQSPGS
jgi:hypothetical protein